MTNVSGTPQKRATRRGLFDFAVESLEKQGYRVTRVPRGGKASLRQITKDGVSQRVSIRTSQDAWIAFPPKAGGQGWVTLDDVDFVVASSVDDKHNPTFARVHMVPGDEARDRWNRAYQARKAANHVMPEGRGIWLSLYDPEASDPVSHVGAGMGNDFPAIATLDLRTASLPNVGGEAADEDDADEEGDEPVVAVPVVEAPLTIPEAKRRLAIALGVPETAIKITIEH
jgi:hypothetical protein